MRRAKFEIINGFPPFQKHSSDAGWDISLPEDLKLLVYECKLVPLGLKVIPPDGYYFQLSLRSSAGEILTQPNSPGIIDPDYRGELKIWLLNHSTFPQMFTRGHRIAQLTLHKLYPIKWEEIAISPDTDRGIGGFGSTGGAIGRWQ